MKLIPHYSPAEEYEISGPLLNQLIDAVNEWSAFNQVNVVVGTGAASDAGSRLDKSPAGTVLTIVVPPCS